MTAIRVMVEADRRHISPHCHTVHTEHTEVYSTDPYLPPDTTLPYLVGLLPNPRSPCSQACSSGTLLFLAVACEAAGSVLHANLAKFAAIRSLTLLTRVSRVERLSRVLFDRAKRLAPRLPAVAPRHRTHLALSSFFSIWLKNRLSCIRNAKGF